MLLGQQMATTPVSNPSGEWHGTADAATGKSEEEILKENVRQERLRLRLNSQQTEEKETLEVRVQPGAVAKPA
jgi:hypothetical protein